MRNNQNNLPTAFKMRMRKVLGREYNLFINSYEFPAEKGLLVGTHKISLKNFEKVFPYEIIKVPYTKDGYYTKNDLKIGHHPLHHAGALYMQEPSSMAVTNSVLVLKGSCILDVCAAPGGKTVSLAHQIGEDGILVSNEVVVSRCKTLYRNVERMGFRNVLVTNFNGLELSSLYKSAFDYVFVDAPCSGEGMFRKDEGAILNWSEETTFMCAERSLEILKSVSPCLKKNGILVYSTCTFSKEENEGVIEKFLDVESYELLDIPTLISYTKEGLKTEKLTQKCRRFYPYISKGEGQFIAVLKKKDGEEKRKYLSNFDFITDCERHIIETFINNHLKIQNFIYKKRGYNILAVPKAEFMIPSYKVMGAFVKMGEIVKGRLIPHHQFFSAYGSDFKNQLCLSFDDKRVYKYLKGEEIEDESVEDGYGVLLVNGCSLGGFKCKSGKLKNHYPKVLRER